jgi:DNA-binding SARP family transcriptional activator
LAAALMLLPRQELSYHRLITLLWDNPPASALHNLRSYAMRLRQTLSAAQLDDRLVTTRGGDGGYRLAADDDEVDSRIFSNCTTRGRAELSRGNAPKAVELLSRGLALWRGTAGAGAQGSGLLRAHLELLNETRLAAVEVHAQARLMIGDRARLIPELAGLVTLHPLRERLWDLLIRAHYLEGNHVSALAAYDRARAAMGEELGLDVSPQLRLLHLAVLRHDADVVRSPGQGPWATV